MKKHSDEYDLHTSRIDPDTIELYSERRCVLAQAGGRPFQAIASDAGLYGLTRPASWVADHGFDQPDLDWIDSTDTDPGVADDQAMTDEWRRVLTASVPF
jgi:hypothetical protein